MSYHSIWSVIHAIERGEAEAIERLSDRDLSEIGVASYKGILEGLRSLRRSIHQSAIQEIERLNNNIASLEALRAKGEGDV